MADVPFFLLSYKYRKRRTRIQRDFQMTPKGRPK
jgi:hypothetical protein